MVFVFGACPAFSTFSGVFFGFPCTAATLAQAGDDAHALEAYDRILSANPMCLEALIQTGLLYYRRSQHDVVRQCDVIALGIADLRDGSKPRVCVFDRLWVAFRGC